MDQYKTIAKKSIGEFKDKGSKFIGYAFPVKTESQAKELIDQITKKHPKSRHVCFALRVGVQEPLERTSDAGEPSGTAGKPILGQIHSHELTNVLIVVVRYFGGTLLGVSGLINAYKSAAAEAILNNKVITDMVKAIFDLNFKYDHYHEIMNLLKREDVDFIDQIMEQDCYIRFAIKSNKAKHIKEILSNFKHLEYSFVKYD